MEQQPLQFRGQRTARNREPTVGTPELRERVGHRLAYDHQGGGCKHDEGDEERGSRLHENTTARIGTERLDGAAVPPTHAAGGPGVPAEATPSAPWLVPRSSSPETF